MIDNTLLFLCAKWHYRYEDSTGVCKGAHSGQQKYLRVCAISLMKMLVYDKEADGKMIDRSLAIPQFQRLHGKMFTSLW